MKLLFVINNSDMQYMEYSETGNIPPLRRRAVEIELTKEQIEIIGLRKLSTNPRNKTDIMETIESVSLVLPADDFSLNTKEWWDALGSAEKTKICDTHTELLGGIRRWETLTDKEVETLYNRVKNS